MANNKSGKVVKITALASLFAAVATFAAFLFNHSKKKKSVTPQSNEDTDENEIDNLDISALENDIPRQYVSISITDEDNK